jgi:hypothetical protein
MNTNIKLQNNNSNIKYISGKFALNIRRNQDKTFGDWHGNIWNGIENYPDNRVLMFGEKCKENTNMIWGNYGVYEGKKLLVGKTIKTREDKIFVASHIRAVLDLLYYYIKNYKRIWEIDEAAKDYIFNKNKIEEMLKMAKKIESYLDNEEIEEYKKWYKKQMYFYGELYEK